MNADTNKACERQAMDGETAVLVVMIVASLLTSPRHTYHEV